MSLRIKEAMPLRRHTFLGVFILSIFLNKSQKIALHDMVIIP